MTTKSNSEQIAFERKIALYNFFFGMMVIGGGLMGYFLKHSLPSLGAGLVLGNLLMLSLWGTGRFQRDPKPGEEAGKIWGYYLATILAVILLIFFIIRMLSTQNLMPGLPISILAIIGILLNVKVIHQKRIQNLP
ncbi:MAG: TMEM14 family protein [Candidatus Caenarcaniphilales bacterium]|nr:TMEM14 family protein [Candidatus Caenarcaniphilales bacterium]